jgi:rubrerythrin
MGELRETRTHENLKAAFARESQVSRRYLAFAEQAAVDGRPAVAELFRTLAEGETGHALGLLAFLADADDPLTGLPIGTTEDDLRAALAGEADDVERYAAFAVVAREEGFPAIADWLDAQVGAERSHAARLQAALDEMG